MTLVELLKADHEISVSRAWPLFARIGTLMKEGKTVPSEVLNKAIDFLDGFILRHHFPMEEALLDMARKHGIDKKNPLIDKIIMEHEEARNYVAILSEALEGATQGNSVDFPAFIDNSDEFVDFLVMHEIEENEKLFPLMERILTRADQQKLLKRFPPRDEEHADEHFSRLLQQIEHTLQPL